MRLKSSLLVVFIVCVGIFIGACVHLPTFSDVPTASRPSVASVTGNAVLPPGPIVNFDTTVPGRIPLHPPASPAVGKAPSATHTAIQHTVNWLATLCILGGLACLAFGGLAISGGQLWPGIRLVAVGLLVPILGVWFAYHWGTVIICALGALGLFEIVQHWETISPFVKKAESAAEDVLHEMESKAESVLAPKSPLSAPAVTPSGASLTGPPATPTNGYAVSMPK